jgi:hypothetical protein
LSRLDWWVFGRVDRHRIATLFQHSLEKLTSPAARCSPRKAKQIRGGLDRAARGAR